jgi:tRNA-guanine family transglycosylase
MTAGMQKIGNTIPIIHVDSKDFIKIVRGVVEGINPQIIGIAERELGATLLERARCIKKIRNELDKINRNIPIHLLGTGNPISILVYSLCGADLFDSFDWYNSIVNPQNGHLYHFIQRELVVCNCKACEMKNIPYHLQTMAHNLIFYENFTAEIRKAIEEKRISQIINKYLPAHIHQKIKKIVEL